MRAYVQVCAKGKSGLVRGPFLKKSSGILDPQETSQKNENTFYLAARMISRRLIIYLFKKTTDPTATATCSSHINK